MQRQQGFSLIEVMITMVVISVGLLGIAAIIVTNLKNNQSSFARSQATVLANDIIDRMRANRTVAEGFPSPYTLALTDTSSGTGTVAADDLNQWIESVTTALPKGKGAVIFNEDSGNVKVTIEWDDRRSQDGGKAAGASGSQTLAVETHL